MNRNSKLSQQLFVQVLVISFFLQSCNKSTNLPVSLVKRQVNNIQLGGKQDSSKRVRNKKLNLGAILLQKEGQLQVAGEEEFLGDGLLTSQQLRYEHVGKRGRKRIRDAGQGGDQEKVKKRSKKQLQGSKCRAERWKRRTEKKREESQKVRIYCGLEAPEKKHKQSTITRKTSSKTRIKIEKEKEHIELVTPKKQIKTKRKDKVETENKARKRKKLLELDTPSTLKEPDKTQKKDKPKTGNKNKKRKKFLKLNNSGTLKQQVKKNKRDMNEEETAKLSLLDFPAELLEEIMSYLSFKEAMIIKALNPYFYEFITGYRQVGVVGVGEENKPYRSITNASWSLKHAINFSKLAPKLATMPSFLFYQFAKRAINLPKAYWPYLEGTQFHTLVLCRDNESSVELEVLNKSLRESNIRTIHVRFNQSGNAAALFKKFKRKKRLGKLSIHNIKVGDRGIDKWAKSLRGTEVQKFVVADSKMGPVGAWKIGRGLKGTQVREVDLRYNRIGILGVKKLAKRLKHTNVEVLNLSSSNLSELAGDEKEMVIELAKSLCGTKVHTVILKNTFPFHKISIRILLAEQYPHIRWIL
ncbi:MAG: hypothetical protein BGO68_02300 [Candidatus Amoebophilus sp. 36-38]|nr:MAG: hypothetical protein BGO68_02300 [Candidatus Amoebophilus sp. 36-38]